MNNSGLVGPGTKILVVKGSGGAGLGDKLRAVISAIIYARLSGRSLYVDWNDTAYGDGVTNYFSALFRLENVQTVGDRPLLGSVRPSAWRGKLHLNWDQLYAEYGTPPWNRVWAREVFSFDQGVLDWDEDVCVMWDFDQFEKLIPYLPRLFPAIRGDEPVERLQGEVLNTHVRPVQEVADAVAAYRAEMHEMRPLIGLHVRATDEHYRARQAPPVAAYVKAARDLQRRSGARAIFLSTDNRDVQELFQRQFGKEQVMWTNKWLPPSGVALHFQNKCPDRLQSLRDALIDIYLLASCDGLVSLGNSSFSALARMVSTCSVERQIVLHGQPPLLRRLWNRAVTYVTS